MSESTNVSVSVASNERPDFDWLNEDSRVFLQRGYLMEGVTAIERIRQISEVAERILGIEGYADKFYKYMARGYYSLSSPIWSNYGLTRGLPISCITGDTWVNTDKGGKQAKDIQIGDMVLTHKNRFRPVTKIIPTKNKDDIWELRLTDIDEPLYITGNHLVYTDSGWVRVDELDTQKHVVATSNITYTDNGYDLEDSLVYKTIQSLMKTDRVEDVWDFTVDEDHSFTAGNIVVHNCYGSTIEDSIDGILSTHHEIGIMTKMGGGTSAYFGDIRPRGSNIRDNGKSNGSFQFLSMYDTLISTVSQGTSRRGMMAAYIDIDHADIDEWLDIHTEGNPIQNMYYGVCVGREWLQEMRNGDKHKRDVWAKVLKRKMETGIPYIFFKDNVNDNKPRVYKDKNMEILASNLCCIAGDQVVLVKDIQGNKQAITIIELVERMELGQEFTIYAFNETTKSSDYYPVLKAWKTKQDTTIRIKNEVIDIRCTKDHKFLSMGDITKDEDDSWIEAKDTYDHYIRGTVGCEKITTIEESDEVIDVYDITVDEVHNFFVFNSGSTNINELSFGVLAHNCEIALPANHDESFVCCLSSMNLLHYDEWKNTDAVETLTYFLDSVLSDFILKAKHEPMMYRAARFAERHRAIGVGVLGWHSYLQSKMISFGSFEAMRLNNEIFKTIKERTYKASENMAEAYGEPEVLVGYGRRNTTTMAVAPTKSSSAILGGVSSGIEPYKSNHYIKDLAKIKTVFKNPYLVKLLESKGLNTPEVWEEIDKRDGSVQHMTELTDHEREVFKTFSELSQLSVIQQAAQRQQYIDQGQSLNIMIHPNTPIRDVNKLYLTAEELGIKGIYYQFSINAAQSFNNSLLTTCASCEA